MPQILPVNTRIEVPGIISAEQRCFSDLILFGVVLRWFTEQAKYQCWSALFHTWWALIFSESALFGNGELHLSALNSIVLVSNPLPWGLERPWVRPEASLRYGWGVCLRSFIRWQSRSNCLVKGSVAALICLATSSDVNGAIELPAALVRDHSKCGSYHRFR